MGMPPIHLKAIQTAEKNRFPLEGPVGLSDFEIIFLLIISTVNYTSVNAHRTVENHRALVVFQQMYLLATIRPAGLRGYVLDQMKGQLQINF